MDMSGHGAPCGSAVMTDQTTNLHFHGTSAKPVCHQDDALRTMVNPGESFDYDVVIPADEPPGLYWYHPHIHGLSEAATQGGASGAIVIEGIEQAVAEVRDLPQRLIVVRDHLLPPGVT
jgi:FtsP/CotA-like multicopper oxidase with cupredoxin domain